VVEAVANDASGTSLFQQRAFRVWTLTLFMFLEPIDYGTDRLKIECQMILRGEVTIEMPTVDG
jgi:hypothetical protein